MQVQLFVAPRSVASSEPGLVLGVALIIAYFMHMKFEVSRMRWLTMASLVFCLAMMCVFFPDAFRVIKYGVH